MQTTARMFCCLLLTGLSALDVGACWRHRHHCHCQPAVAYCCEGGVYGIVTPGPWAPPGVYGAHCEDKAEFRDVTASRSGNSVTVRGKACLKVQTPNPAPVGPRCITVVDGCVDFSITVDINTGSASVTVGDPNSISAKLTATIEGPSVCLKGTISGAGQSRDIGKLCVSY